MNLIGFLESNFLKLPKWARVVAYFLMMALLMYLLVTPRFINGQIVARTKNGGLVPYRGVELQTHVDGRTMKYQTNEDGYWSIPIVSRLPEAIHMQVFHQDEGAWFPLVIAASDFWSKPWDNAFRVVILKDQPFVAVEHIASIDDRSWFAGITGRFSNAWQAQAAELALPPAVQPPPSAQARDRQKKVAHDVVQTYANVFGTAVPSDPARVAIGSRSSLSYIQRIQLIQAVEQTQQLKIPDQHWKSFETLAELCDYIYKRKALENANPRLYGRQQQLDWGSVNAQLPPAQKPRFVEKPATAKPPTAAAPGQ